MKKKIAIVAGGDSGEYVISIKSSKNIHKSLDSNKYEPYTIVVKGKNWFHITDDGSETPVNKDDFSIILHGEKIIFDCAFITIHGTPGEDGKLQGYFDLIKMPYTSSGQLPSALTFNKFFTNQLVAHWGFPVARNVRIKKDLVFSVDDITNKVTLPVFVKPNKGGSSLGTTKVEKADDLLPNIKLALEHDDEVLVEEYLPGTELTCGTIRYNDDIITFPVTEIVSKTASKFFDYEAKYTKGASDEITPARISKELSLLVQNSSKFLYEKFELSGIVRFDYIFCRDTLYFLEVNTVPGMTDESIVPQQASAAGVNITELFSMSIDEAIRKSSFV
jgi:D-alanine-D-alanine ligase